MAVSAVWPIGGDKAPLTKPCQLGGFQPAACRAPAAPSAAWNGGWAE